MFSTCMVAFERSRDFSTFLASAAVSFAWALMSPISALSFGGRGPFLGPGPVAASFCSRTRGVWTPTDECCMARSVGRVPVSVGEVLGTPPERDVETPLPFAEDLREVLLESLAGASGVFVRGLGDSLLERRYLP